MLRDQALEPCGQDFIDALPEGDRRGRVLGIVNSSSLARDLVSTRPGQLHFGGGRLRGGDRS